LETDPNARSGKGACRACGVFNGTWSAHQQRGATISRGDTFVSEIWVRAPTGDAATSISSSTLLAIQDAQGTSLATAATTGPALDSTWKPVAAVVTVEADGATMIFLQVVGYDQGCILLDDATVYKRYSVSRNATRSEI